MAGLADLVESVHKLLAERGATVAVAESLTGGLVAAAITDRPGASTIFSGSLTAYSTKAKADLLGVDPALLAERGAVGPDVALAMAAGVRDRFGADVGLATTGVAGPQPQDGQAIGTVYIAVSSAMGSEVISLVVPGNRVTIRRRTVVEALALLRRNLEGSA